MTILEARALHFMLLTRRLEERLVALKRQGRVPGGVFRSLGQEACGVGPALAVDPDRGDVLCPMIRGMGALLAAGVSTETVLHQYVATAESPTRGRDLHVCFSRMDRGVLGHIAPLGVMLPVIAGVALAMRAEGSGRVALVWSGDGTLSTGAAHEGLNLIAVQRLPVIVIAEQNGWAYSTPPGRQSAITRLADRGAAYGLPAETLDGNDVMAVHEATRAAVERARAGGGPSFIELVTYRRTGHAEHDDQRYVPPGQVEEWAKRDPIDQLLERLRRGGAAADLASLESGIAAELDAAVDRALAAPLPLPLSALEDVMCAPIAESRWYRQP